MCAVLSATQTWLDSHQYLALWLEGIALLAIFIWDRIDASQQHKQTLAQICASDAAANAANKSAEALINSERAWVIPELFSQAVKGADGMWYRRRDGVSLSTQEVLKGRHQDYFLKVTNMGRTPAQILALEIRYSCLPEGRYRFAQESAYSYGTRRNARIHTSSWRRARNRTPVSH